MSIVSGLVDTHHGQDLVEGPHRAVARWLLKHSWQVVLAGCLGFWALVAAALYFV